MSNLSNFSMNRRDAIQLAVGQYLWLLARGGEDVTERHLRQVHDQGAGQWDELIDELIRHARPLVDEDGTWTRTLLDYDGQHTVVERLALDDVLAGARYAAEWMAAEERGDYAAARAVSDGLAAYRRVVMRQARDVFSQALAAERGLVD